MNRTSSPSNSATKNSATKNSTTKRPGIDELSLPYQERTNRYFENWNAEDLKEELAKFIDLYEEAQTKFLIATGVLAAPSDSVTKYLSTEQQRIAGRTLALELAYLRYFYQTADFGPAHGDVMYVINKNYSGEIPEGYEYE